MTKESKQGKSKEPNSSIPEVTGRFSAGYKGPKNSALPIKLPPPPPSNKKNEKTTLDKPGT